MVQELSLACQDCAVPGICACTSATAAAFHACLPGRAQITHALMQPSLHGTGCCCVSTQPAPHVTPDSTSVSPADYAQAAQQSLALGQSGCWRRSQWMYPILAPLMLHCQAELPRAYQALQAATPADSPGTGSGAGAGSTADEVVQAAILAELSTDYLGLVLHLIGGALPLGSPAIAGEALQRGM